MTLGLVPVMEVNDPALASFPVPPHALRSSRRPCSLSKNLLSAMQLCVCCTSRSAHPHTHFSFFWLALISPPPRRQPVARLCLHRLSPSVLPFHLADAGRPGAEGEGGGHRDQRAPELPLRPGCRRQEPQGALIKNSPQLLVVSFSASSSGSQPNACH